MHNKQILNYKLGIIAVFIVIVTCLLFIFSFSRTGFVTPEDLAQAYLSGLAAKNFDAIKRLVPNDHIADTEIKEKLNALGNINKDRVRIQIVDTLVDPARHRELILIDTQSDTELDRLALEKYDGKRWYLILGRWKYAQE